MITATTKSGARYIIEDGRWSYLGSGSPIYALTILSMKTFTQAQAAKHAADSNEDFWKWIHSLPEATKPKVGKRLYISGMNEWRISSVIVDVEES